jgi:hypothetical protein
VPSRRRLHTSSAGRVQLRVHTRGSQAPVASQKGHTAPLLSTMGTADLPKMVPDVPRLTTSCPGCSSRRASSRCRWPLAGYHPQRECGREGMEA